MRYEEGLKYKEIAEKAGRSEECVKKRVLRLRAKIKGILKELSRDDEGSLFIKQKAVAF